MIQDYVTSNTLISGVIGTFAPIVFPYIFALIERITKKAMQPCDKKTTIMVISMTIVFALVAFNLDWTGNFWEVMKKLGIAFVVDNVVFMGMVNNIYVGILKLFPALDNALEKSASKLK
jgi:uncharacterized membrane protein